MTVCNGNLLNISHIGSSILPSNKHSPLALNNILHVPSITKNILSISQITKDNNISVEFMDTACLFKDKISRKPLLKGVHCRMVCTASLHKLNQPS